MEDYGACAIELNLSCPHAKGYGMEVGTDPALVRSIVSGTKDAVSIPVWAKLTPNTHILNEIGRAVEDGGGDAIVAINTLKAMVISPEFARPFLSNRFGGLSGPAVRSVGVRDIYDLYDAVSIPLVGVGGISDWRDAAQYIMAGARAFQVGSAVAKEGPEVFGKINRDLLDFMRDHGYGRISDMVGAAHD
ncbi:tRNA-dihydrouridine synthase [Candidatus Methanomethylophilus sp. 1R26]|uniref:tRNA-dihydrouridine synthase n=1 Tax=Candidatus Methanomethylophilus sp. 1R26 TaxID=1769296 RepID=UPI000A4F7A94|nr:tRNA-dihydrouridine synthase [Candidatus Methanomethylophilus sp. 1R26]